jgi:cellulose synthase/poly-beta-1,6-N-acetylglucosamine synthase-like glycosyltransferase
MIFSVVVPTFSRPDEVNELLASLTEQDFSDFEVIIADGSINNRVKQVVDTYASRLKLKYLHEMELGISESRNWGVEAASGDYVVFFDSDCVIPAHYFSEVYAFMKSHPVDVWGGPDKAHASFDSRQKSISYAMTSIFTTGGIRGKKKHLGQYQPRTFNMGIRRDVFNEAGGFGGLKVSEDIDLSMRLIKDNYRIDLIENAYVYHKRRSTLYKFFRQVLSFGSGRIDLQLKHGDALKLVHLLPAFFVIYLFSGIIAGAISVNILVLWAVSLFAYALVILIDSSLENRNVLVGLLSVYVAFIMLIGYGLGLIKAIFMRYLLRSKKESVKPSITREA